MCPASDPSDRRRSDPDPWQPPTNTIDRHGRRCETCRAWSGVGASRGQCLAREVLVQGRRAYLVTLGQDGAACPDYIRAEMHVDATELATFERQRDHDRAVRARAEARRMTPRRRKILELLSRPAGATARELEAAGIRGGHSAIKELRRIGYTITAARDGRRDKHGPVPQRFRLVVADQVHREEEAAS